MLHCGVILIQCGVSLIHLICNKVALYKVIMLHLWCNHLHNINMALNDKKTINVRAKNSKEFYFTFLQMLKAQLKLKGITDIHVLTNLCIMMEYNSTRVKLTTSDRKRICEELSIKNSHLSNSLKRLVEIGLIVGIDGDYEINPFLAWKGSLDEREKLLMTKGVDIRIRFSKTSPEQPYNPMVGGSKEFDK